MAVTPNEDAAVQAIEEAGPAAHGDPMGTPVAGERMVWEGRPDLLMLARTAFHTRTVGIYFLILIAASLILGNVSTAIVCTVLALAAQAVLYAIAWQCRRTTVYILTDTRLIMRIGMAIETRINIPLKHVTSADLRMRGKDHGDITLSLGGERMLTHLLLWPHVRPWRFSRPEPMLRAVPEAQKVAQMLAEACARNAPDQQSLTEINDAAQRMPHHPFEKAARQPAQRGKFDEAHA